MRISLKEIPPQGLPIDTTISLEALNMRLQEGNSHGIIFTQEPHITLTVFGTADGAQTKGTIRSRYRQPCSLCTDELERDLELSADFYLRPKPEERSEFDEEEYEDDIGIIYYENEEVNLEEVIQESLILSLSIYWQPPRDAKGNCSICTLTFEQVQKKLGTNLEKPERVTLGALFKKAGVE